MPGTSRTAPANQPARFIECQWACVKCKKRGDVRPWAHQDEADFDAARRHAAWTRRACLDGCAYAALPKPDESTVSAIADVSKEP